MLLIFPEKHRPAPSFRRSPPRCRGCRHPAQKSPKPGGEGPRQAFKAIFPLFIEPDFGASESRALGPPSGRTRAPAGGVLSPRREAGRGRARRLRAALCSVNSRAGRGRSLFESSHPLESGQKKRGAPLREHLCMMIIRQERCAFQADKPCHSLPFRVIPCQLFCSGRPQRVRMGRCLQYIRIKCVFFSRRGLTNAYKRRIIRL